MNGGQQNERIAGGAGNINKLNLSLLTVSGGFSHIENRQGANCLGPRFVRLMP